MNSYYLPAEWEPQSAVQLTWPHASTDWAPMLPVVERVYTEMAHAIARHERLIIVTPEPSRIDRLMSDISDRIIVVQCDTNDTWARDHAFITLSSRDAGEPRVLDFTFNGWGMKFAANLDNQINRTLYATGVLHAQYSSHLDFVLEGGSIESDGQGTLLTTSQCLLSANRNQHLTRSDIECQLKQRLCASHVLWLDHGFLLGDDTDSHIDTLARLCPGNAIAYVKCNDTSDEHYNELHDMEEQLKSFRTPDGQPYTLIPLPLPDAIYDDEGCRLPATYANFLIINGAVLLPVYGQPQNDQTAISQMKQAFPNREIVAIDCTPIIYQHGSLHCCTMQYPANVIR